MPQLIYLCSLLPIPVLAVTAIVMYRRKQHRLYPVFWPYLIFQLSRVTVEVIIYPISQTFFFYAYWTASACSVIFSLLLLRSIFLTVLEGYSPLTRLRRFGYEGVLLTFWVFALLVTFHNNDSRIVSQLIFDAEQAISFTAVGMFVFVVGSSFVLGIKWTSAVCGIALGVGLLGTVDLLVFGAQSHGHLLSNTAASWIETLAYLSAVGVYAFYFVPGWQEVQVPAAVKPELVRWADEVRGSVSK